MRLLASFILAQKNQYNYNYYGTSDKLFEKSKHRKMHVLICNRKSFVCNKFLTSACHAINYTGQYDHRKLILTILENPKQLLFTMWTMLNAPHN